jgi:phosphatidylglycerol:prolipoprotein diacylglycerol transferase
MLRYPQIDPVALHLGPVQVHWYGIMYVIGFGVAWWLARRRAADPRSTWNPTEVDDLIFWLMLGVILGGRIGYVLFYGWQFWQSDPWYPLKIYQGGMSFHGALIGVLVALLLFGWQRRRHFLDLGDFAAALPGLGFLAGRIGNFINGELWGAPTTVPWGFLVPGNGTQLPMVRHASQLYEGLLEGLALFVLLWWFSAKPRARGMVGGLFLAWYGAVRIAIEFVREPDAQLGYLYGGWVTMGQVLSLPMLIGGLLLLALGTVRPQPSGNWRGTP